MDAMTCTVTVDEIRPQVREWLEEWARRWREGSMTTMGWPVSFGAMVRSAGIRYGAGFTIRAGGTWNPYERVEAVDVTFYAELIDGSEVTVPGTPEDA